MSLHEQILENEIEHLKAKIADMHEIISLLGVTSVYESTEKPHHIEMHSRLDRRMILGSLNPKELIRKLIIYHANEIYSHMNKPTNDVPSVETILDNPKSVALDKPNKV